MQKGADVNGYFDDGIVFRWEKPIKPIHVHFEVSSGDNKIEACDVKMYSLDPIAKDSTQKSIDSSLSPKGPLGYTKRESSEVFLFRVGYFGYMKLNVDSLTKKST